MTVELAIVPHEAQHLVIVASPVRKPAHIVAPFLQSLAWQVKPRGVQFVYVFTDDGCDPEARKLLDDFVIQYGGMVWSGTGGDDFTDQGVTHGWTNTAMNRVGAIKDQFLEFARINRAEAVFLVDADLICDPMTFTSLWSVTDQIVSAVYWTRWQQPPPEHPPIHAGPQVWLQHPYSLAGRGMEEWEFRHRLMTRQLTEVSGLGACTMIRRDALMKGVSFAPWPGNTLTGIGQGEDRHFCMRAEALHLRMMADPWPDIFHIYHRPTDEERIPEMLARLERSNDFRSRNHWDDRYGLCGTSGPLIGDLVSLQLQALEPVLTPHGPFAVPAQLVRGRLGSLALHLELEDAILDMQRGQDKVVPAHFAHDYVFPPYRGQRRLIRVTLLDHKPMGYAPVVEEEVIVNRAGRGIDTTTLGPDLIEQMREIHG